MPGGVRGRGSNPPTYSIVLAKKKDFQYPLFSFIPGQRTKLGKKEIPPCSRSGCFLEASKKQAKIHRTFNSKFQQSYRTKNSIRKSGS
jgi:hypothetical protein